MIKLNNNVSIVNLMLFLLLAGCQHNNAHLDLNNKDIALDKMVEPVEIEKGMDFDENLKKARDSWAKGKKELAQAYYVKAYKAQPNNAGLIKEMAKVYEKLDNNDLLEICYRLILDMQPNNQEIIEKYGLLLIRQKKIPEAEKLLKQAIDKTENWEVYNGLGVISDIQGRHEEARLFYGKAILINKNNPEVLNNIGYSFYMEDQLDKAQGYFLWVIRIDKGFKKASFNYALSLARQKKYNEALRVFLKVTNVPEANNNTGYIAMKNGDYKEAKFFLNQAIKSSPRFYEKAHRNLKDLYYLRKNKSY